MAHMIAKTADGRDAMAYVGETPWHGLGQELTEDASLAVWAKESGLDFELATAEVQFNNEFKYDAKKVMYRKDTNLPLGIVSNRYQIVQPIEVLNFFKNMVGSIAHLETAGVLRNGAHYWALARMDGEFDIAGDKVKQYLLLASSADGSLATQARLTSVRVVCNNTLQLAQQGVAEVVVRHSSVFKPEAVVSKLADCNDIFKTFEQTANILANLRLSSKNAQEVFTKILGGKEQVMNYKVDRALQLFKGEAIGANLESSKGTAWGALNAVTQMVDWEMSRTASGRLNNAWFGNGVDIKQNAVNELMAMAA
jgi:phage/plasmid-like protein (TIGR03299 family)